MNIIFNTRIIYNFILVYYCDDMFSGFIKQVFIENPVKRGVYKEVMRLQ